MPGAQLLGAQASRLLGLRERLLRVLSLAGQCRRDACGPSGQGEADNRAKGPAFVQDSVSDCIPHLTYQPGKHF